MKNAHKTMRLYIAGPISGLPNDNIEEFRKAERFIRENYPQITTVLPQDFVEEWSGDKSSWQHGDYMRVTGIALLGSDAAVFLNGWENSVGAKMEHALCLTYNIPTIHFESSELRRFLDDEFKGEPWNNFKLNPLYT